MLDDVSFRHLAGRNATNEEKSKMSVGLSDGPAPRSHHGRRAVERGANVM
jgi:hypothetical protein